MQDVSFTSPESHDPSRSNVDASRLYEQSEVRFSSEAELREWLSSKGVDLELADSRKGIAKLYNKIEKGEARMLFDEESGVVFRAARVAKIEVEVTISGVHYPLIELCQVFLNSEIDESLLDIEDPAAIVDLVADLEIRAAHVRDSQELWETLLPGEDPSVGARRGLVEELRYSEQEASRADMQLTGSTLELEKPIDWPGIPSILEIVEAKAVLPEDISKPAYAELEGGDQITIFVATPSAAFIRHLLSKVIPSLHHVSTPTASQ